MVKFKKRSHLSKLTCSLGNNPRKFWSYYKTITKTTRIVGVIKHESVQAIRPIDQANLFNVFFHSVLAPPDSSSAVYLPRLNYSVKRELSEVRVTSSNILKQLQSLDVNKACLRLPSKLLQACANKISPSLCRLFNLSLELGTFPDKWKDANHAPILKCESKTMVSNYRGISLLGVLSKILEKQVYNEIFGIICPHLTHWQHGFLPGKSTVSQLSQIVHQFAVALEKRQQVDVIYLDFSQAFDRVPHEKLLFKLECLGIGGSLLAWFRSYLSGRRHRVVIDNESSDFLPVTCGVPQGSILGPLLFLLFINDMLDAVSKETSLPVFADDSKCFRLILGRHDGEKLKDDLNKLFQWSCIRGMEFNAKKCKVLRVARLRSIDDRDYYLGGIKLDRVDVEKDLGILVTHNLSWNNHVDVVSSTAQKMLNVLYRTCKDINDISTKKLLYIAWVRSRLEYASVVWSPHAKRNINNLEQVQHRATRFILGRDYSEYERLSKLNLCLTFKL